MAHESESGTSTAYGIVGFKTSYLKAHHPVEFMTALLNSAIGDYSETTKYIDACSKMNIKVLPPNINHSNVTYSIVSDENVRKIYFGFSAIKGIGDTMAEKIIQERALNGAYKNVVDFLNRISPDTSVMVALIKSGAFGLQNKSNLLLKYINYIYKPLKPYSAPKTLPSKADYIKLGIVSEKDYNKDKRQEYFKELVEIKTKAHEEKERLRKDKHIKELSDKYIGDEKFYEFQTLSIFINDNIFAKYIPMLKNPSEIEGDLPSMLYIGVISSVKKKTQKNGKPYAYVELLTPFGMYEGMAFNQVYEPNVDILKKDTCVAIKAKKSGSQFIISEIKTFDDWKPHGDRYLENYLKKQQEEKESEK